MWLLALVSAWKHGFLFKRVFGCMRAAVYLCALGAVAVILLVTRAKAQLREQSTALGRELAPIADLLDGATALRVNGETLNFSLTLTAKASVKQALDRVQAQCEAHPGPLARELRNLATSVQRLASSGGALSALFSQAAITRQETEDEGSLLCFMGELPDDGQFAQEFERTRDLGKLGRMRYVRVERGDPATGEGGLTRIMALWTEDSLKLESFEPPPFGDAPGSDSALAPRPPGGVRVFSAVAVGSSYAVRLYETDRAVREVLAFYDSSMKGWEQLSVKGYEGGRAYVKDSMPLLVQVTEDGARTRVTVSEAGSTADFERLVR